MKSHLHICYIFVNPISGNTSPLPLKKNPCSKIFRQASEEGNVDLALPKNSVMWPTKVVENQTYREMKQLEYKTNKEEAPTLTYPLKVCYHRQILWSSVLDAQSKNQNKRANHPDKPHKRTTQKRLRNMEGGWNIQLLYTPGYTLA